MPTLADAITEAENALTAYSTAVSTTTNDQAAQATIQTKLDAATAQVTTDLTNQGDAATVANAALQALSAAALATIIPVTQPNPTPSSTPAPTPTAPVTSS